MPLLSTMYKLSIVTAFVASVAHGQQDVTCDNQTLDETYNNVEVTGTCTLSGATVHGQITSHTGNTINIFDGTFVGGNINVYSGNPLVITGNAANQVVGDIQSNGQIKIQDGATIGGKIGVYNSNKLVRVWESTVKSVDVEKAVAVTLKGAIIENGVRVIDSGKILIIPMRNTIPTVIEQGDVLVDDCEFVQIRDTSMPNGNLVVRSNEEVLVDNVEVGGNAEILDNLLNPGEVDITDTSVDGVLTVKNNKDVSITGSDGGTLLCESNTMITGSNNDFDYGQNQCVTFYATPPPN